MAFLRNFLAALLALVVFSSIIVGIIVYMVQSSASDETRIHSNSVLKLNFAKPISEQSSDIPFDDFTGLGLVPSGGDGLVEIKATIAQAKNDGDIRGILLDLSTVQAGNATISEIRRALLDFKESKKFVYAYSENLSEAGYFLASVADSIFLNPAGGMEFNGVSAELMFYKRLFDKWDIKPMIFRVGTYKSAVEPYMLDKMSQANREQYTSFLNSIYNTLIEEVAKARKMDPKTLREISDKMLVENPKQAKEQKLVDELWYYDQLLSHLAKMTGEKDENDVHFVTYADYKRARVESFSKHSSNKLAIIIADGTIVDGRGEEGEIGSITMAKQIRNARLNDKVKAVVLRVNSPGGSALASDVIWREIMLTKKVKPVVASMGDVAASGGYYISMACQKIYAEPNTITGSIGVFGMMLNAEKFLEKHVGVTTDRVSTGQFSGLGSPFASMSIEDSMKIQNSVNLIYEDFTAKAAEGRKMPHDTLKNYAGGRVWSGIEAKQRNLVDEMGGLNDAVKAAAAMANLGDDYEIRYYPQKQDFFKQLFGPKDESTLFDALAKEYPHMLGSIAELKKQFDRQGIQARIPFDFVIR